MTTAEFRTVLLSNPNAPIRFQLPDGGWIPDHFHITEVGRARKDFIDCGGTVRSTTACLLQAWVAEDVEHRLETSKLAHILSLAAPLLESDELPVEVEYEDRYVSQFPIAAAEATASGVVFQLTTKHTDCLAKESCGVGDAGCGDEVEESCCGATGCC